LTKDKWSTTEYVEYGLAENTSVLKQEYVDGETFFARTWDLDFKGHDPKGLALIKTTDKFKTYEILKSPDEMIINDIKFQDPDNGWITGYIDDSLANDLNLKISVAYKTTDGGETWQEKIHRKDSTARGLDLIKIIDDKNIVITSNVPYLSSSKKETGTMLSFISSDGGETWDKFYDNKALVSLFEPEKLSASSTGNIWCIQDGDVYWYNPEPLSVADPFTVTESDIEAYPCPAARGSEVKFRSSRATGQNIDISIYDISGNKVFTGSFVADMSGEITWRTEGLAAGAYTAAILIGKKYLVAKSILITNE
jgi:hypothetical protein